MKFLYRKFPFEPGFRPLLIAKEGEEFSQFGVELCPGLGKGKARLFRGKAAAESNKFAYKTVPESGLLLFVLGLGKTAVFFQYIKPGLPRKKAEKGFGYGKLKSASGLIIAEKLGLIGQGNISHGKNKAVGQFKGNISRRGITQGVLGPHGAEAVPVINPARDTYTGENLGPKIFGASGGAIKVNLVLFQAEALFKTPLQSIVKGNKQPLRGEGNTKEVKKDAGPEKFHNPPNYTRINTREEELLNKTKQNRALLQGNS
jgi:hypothetical protein